MQEPLPIGALFGANVYPYGAGVAASVLCGCLLLLLLGRKRHKAAQSGLLLLLYAVVLCVLFARLGYCLVRARFIAVDYVAGFPLNLTLGGFSLAGGSVGLVLAVWLYARVARQPFADCMDWVAPAAMLTLAGLRLAEMTTLNGVGVYVDNPAFGFFPFAVSNAYGELVFPVFFWEAVTALALGAGLAARYLRTADRPGDTALTCMLLLGLTQVFWESLREDDFLRFGFVRVNQLWGALLAAGAIGLWLKQAHASHTQVLRTILLVYACVTVLIVVEFGLDKLPIPDEALYGAMALALLALALKGLWLRKQSTKGATAGAAQTNAGSGAGDSLPDRW